MAVVQINKNDLIWSYLGTFFRVFTNILLLPIIVYFLSDDELGLWYVFASIAQIVTLFDFGFAPTFSRNIAYIWCGASKISRFGITLTTSNTTDWCALKIIVQTCKSVYFIIAIFALILMGFGGSIYITKISSSGYLNAWAIYALSVSINLLYGYYTSLLRGVGAIAENNKAATYSKIIQLIASCILLFCGMGLVGLSIAYLLSGIVLRFLSAHYFNKYESIGDILKSINIDGITSRCIEQIRTIWPNASREGAITISNYLLTQFNTILCSLYIDLSTTGSYGLALQISTLIGFVSAIPFSTYQTKMQENATSGNSSDNFNLFSRTIVAYIFVYIILSIGCILLLPLIRMFKPTLDVTTLMLSGVFIQFFIYNFYSLCASYISSYNILPYTKAFLVTSVLSVILSWLFIYHFDLGIWSLIIAPIVSYTYNVIKWPNYVLRLFGCSFADVIRSGTKGLSENIREYIHKNQ